MPASYGLRPEILPIPHGSPSILLTQSSGPAPAGTTLFAAGNALAQRETFLAIVVILFGLAMTGAAIYLMKTVRVAPGEVIRLLALMMVVTGVLVLVAAGIDPQQVAPAFGILGTVAGYLLGRGERPTQGRQESNDDTTKPD